MDRIDGLVRDAYVDSGYIEPFTNRTFPLEERYRARALTLTSEDRGELVGTITVIRSDKPGDLPSARYLAQEQGMKNAVEITRLALSPDYRSVDGDRFYELVVHVFYLIYRAMEADSIVISVNPKHERLYQATLFFDRLCEEVQQQGYGKITAPAVALVQDRQAFETMKAYHRDHNPAFGFALDSGWVAANIDSALQGGSSEFEKKTAKTGAPSPVFA
ncbi:MAG: hypothetical protein QNJ84_18665 [Alphaproteobacteria bacterium]|nr:hypothetical protein [Alphaproteobacteria bacterium]